MTQCDTALWRMVLGLSLLWSASGCQISTRTGMYRSYLGWRQFREPQLVLERAPLNDEEPSLWGPRFKTHALRWHDREFGDPRYTYTSRSEVARTSHDANGIHPSEQSASHAEPEPAPAAGANRSARLPPRAPIPRSFESSHTSTPPVPPPGDLNPPGLPNQFTPGMNGNGVELLPPSSTIDSSGEKSADSILD